MASFQEGSRKSGRRTGSGKGRRHDFIPINGDSSFIHVDSKDLKMQDPPHPPPHTHTHTRQKSSEDLLSSPTESPSKASLCFPLPGCGTGCRGVPSFMAEFSIPCYVGPSAGSFKIFLPFSEADTNGGQRGGCLIRVT